MLNMVLNLGGVPLYKLRFISSGDTCTIIREESYNDPLMIHNILGTLEDNKIKGLNCFIMDAQQRVFEAKYTFHGISFDEGHMIINIFFDIEFSKTPS